MALLPTSQPGSVGLEVAPGPGGGLWLSLHVTSGHLMVLLTSQEARHAVRTMTSLLMSPRESKPSQTGLPVASAPIPSPEGGGRS